MMDKRNKTVVRTAERLAQTPSGKVVLQPPSTAAIVHPLAAAPPRPYRVAIVEDDEDIRSVFTELLKSYGHEVSAACDGPSGRDLIATTHPDFAFIDIGLPGF